ncbi:MscL family protein [Roseisolibacter sp. H3M3-2]|uniref:MscL family protein n=1 Tax=Roseisolibacter sp. H3M3-2 TaxID=3031323 RepID=UPI0023D9EB0C|nr:MscL family protein [Roseisolibacter sp. H3M3-2]MDF1505897.1 MscL family protein [Roseisolibacter sp. H3M3-2]
MLKDLRAFLLRENVLALALAVVLGGALARLVGALVEDLIMPFAGAAMPGGAWRDAVVALGPVRLTLGHFLGAVVDFVIVGVVVWRLGRLSGRTAPDAPPTTRPCPYCDMQVSRRATRCGHCTSTLVDMPVLAIAVGD